MIQSLVTVDIALELKKIGFDGPCVFSYRDDDIYLEGSASVGFVMDINNTDFITTIGKLEEFSNWNNSDWVTLPTYEQVFAWFREKEIYGHVARDDGGFYKFIVSIKDGEDYYFDSSVDVEYGLYEDARLECIKELIIAYNENI